MDYHFTRTMDISFEDAVDKVTQALKKEGFGVLTQINVRDTLKKKLNVDFKEYLILGACNPEFAYKALQSEDKIGTMLPCNVIVQESSTKIEVSAINPIASMQAVKNQSLSEVAKIVTDKLKRVIESI